MFKILRMMMGNNNIVSGINLGIDKDGRRMINTKVGLEKNNIRGFKEKRILN